MLWIVLFQGSPGGAGPPGPPGPTVKCDAYIHTVYLGLNTVHSLFFYKLYIYSRYMYMVGICI